MPKRYTTSQVDNVELPRPVEGATIMYPNVIGQTARESTTDYANPRLGEILVSEAIGLQTAIISVAASGGGIVRLPPGKFLLYSDIELQSSVRLIGAGRGATILDFSSTPYGVKMIGNSGNIIENCSIENLTIQNSAATAGVMIDYSDFYVLTNIVITDCSGVGLEIKRSQGFTISNILVENNTGDGILFSAPGDRSSKFFTVVGSVMKTNGGDGIQFDNDANFNTISFTVTNCFSENNDGDGFELPGGGAANFITCVATSNTKGFDVDGASKTLLGCISYGNSDDGFEITSAEKLKIIGCTAYSNGGFDYDVQPGTAAGQTAVFVGNSISATSTVLSTGKLNLGNQKAIATGSEYLSPVTNKKLFWVKNVSGGSLSTGSVVVFSPTADGESVTTTTTQGDDLVFGVVANQDITNNLNGNVLVEGFTSELKVNGTTDIAIGDFLCTYTTAGIAAKAGVGDMAFAIALEAYTANDSNGIIDALIITPRKI